MTTFQAFVVRGKYGPIVTLHAGVDFAGYFWTTTSRSAAKVSALRRDPAAAILSRKHDSWILRAGRAVVVDPARPSDALHRLPVIALAGTALALIAARYPEQLLGYAADAGLTPLAWKPYRRVLIAVRHDDEISWTDDGTITHRTDRFRPVAKAHPTVDQLSHTAKSVRHDRQSSSLDVDGPCWLGLDSQVGPIVLPGMWNSTRSMIRVPAGVLAALNARLPGRVCVTIDQSDSARPSDKSGIIARGHGAPGRVRAGSSSISVDIDTISTWSGFRKGVIAA